MHEQKFHLLSSCHWDCHIIHANCIPFILLSSSGTQMWMVFEYHPQRSLHDYLSDNTITMEQISKITVSVTAGLAYLHQDFSTGSIYKPSIAHCDLKSRNILIKSDSTCCIADFGLAVISLDDSKDILETTSNARQGMMFYKDLPIFVKYFES